MARVHGGHYADEFAENHSKDLLCENASRELPSACRLCFQPASMTIVAKDQENQLFNIESLTEDYEFGCASRYGLKQILPAVIYREATQESVDSRTNQEGTPIHRDSRYFRIVSGSSGQSRAGCWDKLQRGEPGMTRDWWTTMRCAGPEALISQLAILVGYVVLAVISSSGLQHLYQGATDILLSSSRAPGSGTWFS